MMPSMLAMQLLVSLLAGFLLSVITSSLLSRNRAHENVSLEGFDILLMSLLVVAAFGMGIFLTLLFSQHF